MDVLSRTVQGIEEFDRSPDCLLRIGLRRARRRIVIGDLHLQPNDWIVELHLWNEHVPVPRGLADLSWAAAGRRQFERSLMRLADHLHADPRFRNVRALMMAPALPEDHLARYRSRMQFVLDRGWTPVRPARTLSGFLYQLGDDIWLWLLTRAFKPKGLGHDRFFRWRQEFWIGSDAFLAAYGRHGPEPQRERRSGEFAASGRYCSGR